MKWAPSVERNYVKTKKKKCDKFQNMQIHFSSHRVLILSLRKYQELRVKSEERKTFIDAHFFPFKVSRSL